MQEEADKYEEPKKLEEAKEHRMKEAEKHGEPKEAEEAKEQEERKESVRALDGLINIEVSRSKTVQAWYNDLFQYLTIVSALPRVTNSTFCDARKLFVLNQTKRKRRNHLHLHPCQSPSHHMGSMPCKITQR